MICTGTMKQQVLSFNSDGYRLIGTLHLPDEKDPPVVIGSHGLYSSSQSPKQILLGSICIESGIAFFRFNHRGCGDSQGDVHRDTTLASRMIDMLRAVEALKKEGLSCSRLGLFGSSFGGAVCMSLAQKISIHAMVINAAPVKSDRVLEALEKSDPTTFNKTKFLKKRLRFDLTNLLGTLHHILIFHGESDEVVPVSEALEIHKLCGEPKRLTIFEKGDHVISNPDHQTIFARQSLQWFRQYLQ